jgi:hypothetical protein|tara:strand:- start:289 stop:396 length:108 start_codon:yes stop_codon:yes gene_type:complete
MPAISISFEQLSLLSKFIIEDADNPLLPLRVISAL